MEMQEDFIKIHDIPTKVITFGRWITDKPKEKGEKLILIIPGNPGIPAFYKKFMDILHQKLECPVWALGYSGFEDYRQNKKMKFPEPIGLKQQVEQKVAFIQEYISEDTELHIIGHSIGSYMTLELLKASTIEKRIFKTHLLFPTFERMIEAPNGKFLYRFVRHITPIIIFLSWIYSILPRFISLSLLRTHMFLTNIPSVHRGTIHKLINPKVLEQVFFLAFQELEQVRNRDDENFKNNRHRINILYGESDKWCLPEFYANMKRDFPDINVRTSRSSHSFIFHDNQDVADVVCKWITDSKND